jgi:short-subunit dehydrogenase
MNKLLVITGGSRGIGRAIIERFCKAEAFDIVTCGRNPGDLEDLRTSVNQEFGKKIITSVTDMSVGKDIKDFISFIQNLGRPVDVLINNSGFFEPGEITTERDGALEDSMNANLFSAYYLTRGIVSGMKNQKSGHIFNMCSVASIKAYPNGGSYAITKAALLGFSRCLREELKHYGIRVTSIIAGATRTGSWDGTDLPDNRFMKPEDIAELVFASHTISERSVVEELLIRPMLGDI